MARRIPTNGSARCAEKHNVLHIGAINMSNHGKIQRILGGLKNDRKEALKEWEEMPKDSLAQAVCWGRAVALKFAIEMVEKIATEEG